MEEASSDRKTNTSASERFKTYLKNLGRKVSPHPPPQPIPPETATTTPPAELTVRERPLLTDPVPDELIYHDHLSDKPDRKLTPGEIDLANIAVYCMAETLRKHREA
jgi:hypothetical protein